MGPGSQAPGTRHPRPRYPRICWCGGAPKESIARPSLSSPAYRVLQSLVPPSAIPRSTPLLRRSQAHHRNSSLLHSCSREARSCCLWRDTFASTRSIDGCRRRVRDGMRWVRRVKGHEPVEWCLRFVLQGPRSSSHAAGSQVPSRDPRATRRQDPQSARPHSRDATLLPAGLHTPESTGLTVHLGSPRSCAAMTLLRT
jgi:hypothetical protein